MARGGVAGVKQDTTSSTPMPAHHTPPTAHCTPQLASPPPGTYRCIQVPATEKQGGHGSLLPLHSEALCVKNGHPYKFLVAEALVVGLAGLCARA